jgi:hypothetical protein
VRGVCTLAHAFVCLQCVCVCVCVCVCACVRARECVCARRVGDVLWQERKRAPERAAALTEEEGAGHADARDVWVGDAQVEAAAEQQAMRGRRWARKAGWGRRGGTG